MKCVRIILLIALLSLQVRVKADVQLTLYTPNGSSVRATIYSTELTQSQISALNVQTANEFPLATIVDSASRKYNCHSYAWNMVEGGNRCWLYSSDVHKYWDDGSYEEIAGSYAEKIYYYNGDHSAITIPDMSGYAESKWGAGPLVRHEIDYGPAAYNMNYRRFYAAPIEINGSPMMGRSEIKSYKMNRRPSYIASVTWSYPTNLIKRVALSGDSISLSPKTTTTVGDGYVSARLEYQNGQTRTIKKNIGVNGPHWSNVELVVVKSSDGTQVYPSGSGLEPNSYYYAFLYCSSATLSSVDWGVSSNVNVGYFTNSEMYFSTGNEAWCSFHISAKANSYNLTKTILDATVYGSFE